MPCHQRPNANRLMPVILCTGLLLAGCDTVNDNRMPQPQNDHFQLERGKVRDFLPADLLGNDKDPDGDPLTLASVRPPRYGTLEPLPGGGYRYTGNGSVDSDSFSYQVDDGQGNRAWATVTITITAANHPPVAEDDRVSTGRDTPVEIDVLGNDSDPDGNETIAEVIITTPPDAGSATVNAGKAIHFEPAAGYAGTVTLAYQLKDAAGALSNTANVTISIDNHPPGAVGSCAATGQGEPLTGTLGASDPDSGETLTFALGADGAGGEGPMATANGGSVVITDTRTGAYTYTPPPPPGGRGRDTFSYRVTDSAGASSTATETIIVDLKIMAVGDSITSGVENLGNGGIPSNDLRTSFRQPLQQRLASFGYRFDFVGNLDHGCQAGYDADAEGWPGYTAQQILDGGGARIKGCDGSTDAPAYTGIRDALDDNPADIILLHIGTNGPEGTGASDIHAILDDIDQWENSSNGNPVTVVIARIVGAWRRGCSGDQSSCGWSAITELNGIIDSVVQARITNGDDIILVDQYAALDYPADLGDTNEIPGSDYRLHPNTGGYEKMAEVWLYPLIHQGRNLITKGAAGVLMDKCD